MKTEFSNQLTAAEAERLAILAEECAEVIQVIGKILRHGFESCNPFGDQRTNRQLLEYELGHIEYAKSMMINACDLDGDEVNQSKYNKSRFIKPYLHFQENS